MHSARSASRRRVVVPAGLALALAATLGVPAAQAEPVYPSRDDVASAESKADRTRAAVDALAASITAAEEQSRQLEAAASRAAEAYNAAQAELDAARESAASARRSSESAAQAYAAAQTELGAFAAASYRSGGDLANVGALISADGPKTLLDRANTLSVLSTQREYVLARVESARVVAELLSEQADDALAEVRTATDEVRQAQVAARAAVAEQVAAVRELDADQDRLRAELTALDADAVRLAEQRAAGIRERERRQAEAEARRRAEAEAGSGGSGGGGSVPSVPVDVPNGVSVGSAADGRRAVEFAKSKLGTWYLWGGTGPRYDCSGLTLRAWESAGVQLPRVASWQYAATEKISVDDLRPGDLLFYGDRGNYLSIHHVGIYVGGGQMIEAPHTGAQVRYASIWRSDLFGATRP